MSPENVVDPSTVHNQFAHELSRAIAERGLTLARLRAHLQVAGVPVSAATLSYWATGRSRPSRRRSLAALSALEEILGVEPGRLLDLLPAPEEGTTSSLRNREQLLHEAMERHSLPSSSSWQQLAVHHRVRIGADGAAKTLETTLVQRLLVEGSTGWCLVIDGGTGARGEGVLGLSLTRSVDLAEGLRAIEFHLDDPVPRGGLVRTTHRCTFPGAGDPEVHVGYGLRRTVDRLVLEVEFDGEMPASFRRSHTAIGSSEAVDVPQQVRVLANTAQAIVNQAVAGLHAITWQW